jgi:hypothetical protein
MSIGRIVILKRIIQTILYGVFDRILGALLLDYFEIILHFGVLKLPT